MSEVTIIGFEASTYVRSARLACEEKGVPYRLSADGIEAGIADLRGPVHLARHPFGRIPVLLHDGRTVFETAAILHYLDQRFDGPAIFPEDAGARIDAEAWVSALNVYLDRHAVRECVIQYVFPSGPDGGPDRARIDAALPEIAFELGAVDARLGASQQPYFGGERPIAPDFILLPMLDYLANVPEGPSLLANAPHVRRFHDAFRSRASHGATLPENLRTSA